MFINKNSWIEKSLLYAHSILYSTFFFGANDRCKHYIISNIFYLKIHPISHIDRISLSA